MRNACFCFSRPPILASQIHTQTKNFQDALLGTFWGDFILILCAVGWFCATFKGKRALNWDPKSTKWRQNGIKVFVAYHPERVLGKTLIPLCILVGILVTAGTLLVPIGQLLLHFWCNVWEHVLRLLGTLRARRIEHVFFRITWASFLFFNIDLMLKCSY